MSCLGRVQPPGDPRGADDRPVGIDEGDLVGHVPDRQPIGLADELDAVDDPVPGQHVLIVQAELIGQEGRREVVVGLPEDASRAGADPASMAPRVIADQERPVDPADSGPRDP